MTQSYSLWKQQQLAGAYDLATATIKLVLVNIASGHYQVNFATDEFLSAIASGDRIAFTAALTGVAITDGVFSAGNAVFGGVTGPACGAFVMFIDTGNPTTSPLIAYFDNYSGLPITPDGSDINVSFPLGANKIFALVG
jgi:hypothetical protein